MPEFLNLNGVKIYRPGVYATVDASALSSTGNGGGAVAYLGDFPSFEPGQPVQFNSESDLKAYDPSSSLYALWAKLSFAPSQDPLVSGGADTLTIVNAGTSTQAQITLLDGAAGNSAILKSKLWGPVGNRVSFNLSNDSAGDRDQTLVLTSNGVTETFSTTQVDAGTISYVPPAVPFFGGTGDTVSVDWSIIRANVTWNKRQEVPALHVGAYTLTPASNEVPIAGTVDVVVTGDGIQAGESVSAVVNGFDIAGAVLSDTVILTSGTLTGTTSVPFYGYISSITITETTAGTFTKQADFDFSPTDLGLETKAADYDTLQQMLGAIDNMPYLAGTVLEPASIPAAEPDALAIVAISTAGVQTTATLRADLWGFLRDISTSEIVESERATSASAPPAPSEDNPAGVVQGFLMGGSATAADTTTWQTALDSIRNVDIDYIAMETTDIAILLKLPAHFNQAALNGYPRQAWVGAAPGLTLSVLKASWSGVLNNAYIALIPQTADTPSPSGAGSKLLTTPQYALAHAAIEAAMAPGEPLTHKRPDVTAVYQSSTWSYENPDDINRAIKSGLCITTLGGSGLRVERSVTTYLTDNNPIWSEASTVNSVNRNVRVCTLALAKYIGRRAITGTAASILADFKQSLEAQVRDGDIKAFKNAKVVDSGSTFIPSADVAYVEPINFINMQLNAIRIPQSA